MCRKHIDPLRRPCDQRLLHWSDFHPKPANVLRAADNIARDSTMGRWVNTVLSTPLAVVGIRCGGYGQYLPEVYCTLLKHLLPDKLLSRRLDPFIFFNCVLEFLQIRQALFELRSNDGIFGKFFEKCFPLTGAGRSKKNNVMLNLRSSLTTRGAVKSSRPLSRV